MPDMTPQHLLAEIDDLIRTLPSDHDFINVDVSAWSGRAQAVMARWDSVQAAAFDAAIRGLGSGTWVLQRPALKTVPSLLHRARFDLLLRTGGAGTKVIEKGEVFDYFDEVRKVVQQARSTLFFVDPYLNEDFVSRYMPFVAKDVKVRLLGRENIRTLRPAAEMVSAQHGIGVEVRSGSGFHDRFVFVDNSECYQSGASFHQGGRTTPTTLTPIVDAATALLQVYEGVWANSK